MPSTKSATSWAAAIMVAACLAPPAARAGLASDWTSFAGEIAEKAGVETATAEQDVDAIRLPVAMFEAANAIEHRYKSFTGSSAQPAESPADENAAVNEAARCVLVSAYPDARQEIDAFAAAHAHPLNPDPAARGRGLAIGAGAAASILARPALDPAVPITDYRPEATAGHWVPTALPAFPPYVAAEKTWLIPNAASFMPGPPPAPDSPAFARDYQETKSLGALNSTARTPYQTASAKFWARYDSAEAIRQAESHLPSLVAQTRLYALLAVAEADMSTVLVATKMHYMAWRPITAIRNGDITHNPATLREASWLPLLKTPMHPEYPCGHCAFGATIATILAAQPGVTAATTFPFKSGQDTRQVTLATFRTEVSVGRIWGGVHFRSAVNAGNALGARIATLALTTFAQ